MPTEAVIIKSSSPMYFISTKTSYHLKLLLGLSGWERQEAGPGKDHCDPLLMPSAPHGNGAAPVLGWNVTPTGDGGAPFC